MNRKTSLFASWYKMVAFWCGSTMVAVGVALHFPMFWMGRKTGFRLVGMPMDTGMLIGMALIILGFVVTAYGLLPARHRRERVSYGSISPPEDAPLTMAHWIQIGLIGIALVIDVMKSSGYPFHSAIPAGSGLWGGPPGPRGTPPSRCRARRQGPPRGRGRPPHSASKGIFR